MKAVSIERVAPGMVVARTIVGSNGEVLLAKGVSLDEQYVERLKALGIQSLYITDETIGDVEVDDLICEQTRLEARQLTKQAMHDIKVGAGLNVKKVNDLVEKIINEIASNRNLVVCLIDIRALNDYTFAHSVNVAVLSLVVGLALGYARDRLKQLAVGALFHDVGKIMWTEVPAEDSEEFKNHTRQGFEILRKIPGVSLLSAHIPFQHHERIAGSGYPRGLKGPDISEYAKIVAIADVYDNLTSDRPGHSRLFPQHAIEYLILNSGSWFDPAIVKVFVENVAVFPVGTLVMLNTGEKGIVTKVNKSFPTRPYVRILKDAENLEVNPPYEIDLMESHAYFLAKVISDDEL